MIGIYKITSPSDRVYVGQSWDIGKRIRIYRNEKAKRQVKLHSSFNKYGFDAHKFEVVHELPHDVEQGVLNQYEQLYMDLYKNAGFDLLNIREAGSRGKHSEESIQKMRQVQKGKIISEETKEKLRQHNLGNVHSLETRQKISKSSIGIKRPKDEAYRKKISEALMGNTPWNKGTAKPKVKKARPSNQSEETKEKIRQSIKKHWEKRRICYHQNSIVI